MPLYEHIFIARQDISGAQAETLIEEFSKVITDNDGTVVGHEYWGVRPMAYKINKNRKGHYVMLRLDAPSAAVQEMERLERLHEDVMRAVSFRVDEHEDGPSAILQNKSGRDDRRGGRGGRDRDDRPKRDEEAKSEEKTVEKAPEPETVKAEE